MCASTRCPFSSSTRNMAFGNGSTTVPSTRIVSSLGLAIAATYLTSGALNERANSPEPTDKDTRRPSSTAIDPFRADPYHRSRYTRPVGKAVSVRLDDDALRALARLEASGLSRSEAIRAALIEAADRRRKTASLRAEAREIAGDVSDRAEM